MTITALLAGLAAVCAVLAAWEAIAAAEQQRLVRALGRWVAPALAALRSGAEPTSPESRRLVLVAALSLAAAGWFVAGPVLGVVLGAAAPWLARATLRSRVNRRAPGRRGRGARDRPRARRRPRGRPLRPRRAGRGGGRRWRARGRRGRNCARSPRRSSSASAPTTCCARSRGARGQGPCDTLAAAILLQRDAGGDLAGLLRSLAAALEARGRVVAEARSATAQARFTALLVTGLPVAGLALAELAQPGFVRELLMTPRTGILVGLALVLQLVAFACVRRIARVGEMR